MLDLARLDGDGLPLECVPLDLATVAAAEVERMRAIAPTARVAVEAPTPVHVIADPGRIAQILTNLLDNARRHTDEAITVTVTPAASGAAGASVTVTNTGPEIADVDRERIFGRLVRLEEARDRDSGGAGLGLPLARGLARAHGGDLVAMPRRGGAAFQLTLPPA
jgi:signal transduction histidine kinase